MRNDVPRPTPNYVCTQLPIPYRVELEINAGFRFKLERGTKPARGAML